MYFRLPKIRVHLFGYLFSPNWAATLATMLLLPLLLHMGFWQLDRAAQKRALERDFNHRSKTMTLNDIKLFPDSMLRYQVLQVRGHFDNSQIIYVDNKSYQHHYGVEVLTPFILDGSNKVLLINRGFAAVKDRHQLPQVPKIIEERTLTGLIFFPAKPFLLKKEVWDQKWPMMIQGIDLNDLSHKIKGDLLPFILLQKSNDESLLVKDWHPVNFPSYRHTGYAVQWFLLALTLSIIYLKLNLKRCHEK